ncbi:MAG: hypothetical protein ACD_21C00171G0004 [uncultured bacterium]|nr:MAG: hypothetical protein ACD_21C00171G0004 [uncultured bacterium]
MQKPFKIISLVLAFCIALGATMSALGKGEIRILKQVSVLYKQKKYKKALDHLNGLSNPEYAPWLSVLENKIVFYATQGDLLLQLDHEQEILQEFDLPEEETYNSSNREEKLFFITLQCCRVMALSKVSKSDMTFVDRGNKEMRDLVTKLNFLQKEVENEGSNWGLFLTVHGLEPILGSVLQYREEMRDGVLPEKGASEGACAERGGEKVGTSSDAESEKPEGSDGFWPTFSSADSSGADGESQRGSEDEGADSRAYEKELQQAQR